MSFYWIIASLAGILTGLGIVREVRLLHKTLKKMADEPAIVAPDGQATFHLTTGMNAMNSTLERGFAAVVSKLETRDAQHRQHR
jgi:hypothetical protein